MSEPAYLTPDEVAVRLRVDRKTVYAAIHDGRLPALQVGRAYRVAVADLQALAVTPAAGPSIPRPPRKPRAPSGEFAGLARAQAGAVPDPARLAATTTTEGDGR